MLYDFTNLDDASKHLHGYFLHTWFMHYLNVISHNLRNWYRAGLLGEDGLPTEAFKRALFDFNALNLEKLVYICGIYFYVLSSHKKANYYLLQKNPQKRVLYLRGFDFEASVKTEGTLAIGLSSMDTFSFTGKIGDLLAKDFVVFKILSPKDLYWETVGPQRYFYEDFEKIIQTSSVPIRSFFVNANVWKEDVAYIAERVDYFVVYVSSITDGVLWELNHLKERGYHARTTVIFDDEAIVNKELHVGLQERLPDMQIGDVLWLQQKHHVGQDDVDKLRDELRKSFLVVSPEQFENTIEDQKSRILAADSALAIGARETYVEFRFAPAMDAAAVEQIRTLDHSIWKQIEAELAEGIICVPYFLNQVQLRIFTSLMLGQHFHAGQSLAVYAGIMDAVLTYYQGQGRINDHISAEDNEKHLDVLKDHEWAGNHIGWCMLCYGQSHEFGNYTERAHAEFDRLFGAAQNQIAQFAAKNV
jgi:hypothetical protein